MSVFLSILFSFLVVGALGGLLGLGLAFAARAFAVKKDERIAQVEASLPGLNCGACGYAGCAQYAEAIAKGDAELTLCSPGGPAVIAKLAGVLGVKAAAAAEKQVTQVHCRGCEGTSVYLYRYEGLSDCTAAHILYGGDKQCKFGCLGLGSCIKVCPVDAIRHDEHGLVWVDRETCISCGKCIGVCPTGVMRWIPYSADYIVACNSTDRGAETRRCCAAGCIACRLCERKSPEGGFTVADNLARIDYSKTGDRGAAAAACPPKCIIRNEYQAPAPKPLDPPKLAARPAGAISAAEAHEKA